MALNAVFLAEIYLLTQLAPVFRRDAHLLVYDNSCNGLLLSRALNLGFLFIQEEPQFLQFQPDKVCHFCGIEAARESRDAWSLLEG